MVDPARKRSTYADLEAVPAHLVAEIVRGVLRTHPRPGPRHALASSRLGSSLGNPFDRGAGGPGGWWILDEPEFHLLSGEEILVPALAGWRVERMPELPGTSYFEIVPDWICEVLSSCTAAEDRAEKMPIYAEAGVQYAWLLDPILKTLEVFRLEAARWFLMKTFQGDGGIRAEPFDSVELELGALWKPPAR